MNTLNRYNLNIKTTLSDNWDYHPARLLQLEGSDAMHELKEDVKHGGILFRGVLEAARRLPERVTIINTTNEEMGIMAVSYLANIYNEKEGYTNSLCDDTDEEEDEENFGEEDDECSEDEDISGEDENDNWIESPFEVPIISSYELASNSEYDDENAGMFNYLSQANRMKPYWKDAKTEMICVSKFMSDPKDVGVSTPCLFDLERLTNDMKQFSDNRHIFLIFVFSNMFSSSTQALRKKDLEKIHEVEMAFAVQNCAQIIDIAGVTEEEEFEYFQNLLNSHVEEAGYHLRKGFEMNRVLPIVRRVCGPRTYSGLEKIMKYTIKKLERDTDCLKEEDFDMIRQFSRTDKEEEKEEGRAAKAMEQEIIGMEDVKKELHSIMAVQKYHRMRKNRKLGNDNYNNVFLFLGAPGTAKTSIAKLLGRMMQEESLLGDGFACVNGAELKGAYVGHSAPKVEQLFRENDVIVIDEAYSLVSSDHGGMDSFGKEALAQLMIELEKYGAQKLVILAGYGGPDVSGEDNKMQELLNANPGLKSRINQTIIFSSYTEDEMVNIFHGIAKSMGYNATIEADEMIRAHFNERKKAKDFGNGREARSLAEHSVRFLASRLMRDEHPFSIEELQSIAAEDIVNAIKYLKDSNTIQQGKKFSFGFC